MNFLTPLFLLGALAIALPVIFHLIRRTTKERTVFSSLMFLLPTPPRVTKRSRLENIFLLILRSLVLCLLAFAFARPFIQKPISDDRASGAGKRIVVLVDTSASMRRGSLWADARAKADEVFRKATPADQIAVFTFDRGVNRLITFEQWTQTAASDRAALAFKRLTETSPSWFGTHLGNALISAAEALEEKNAAPDLAQRQVVLITDLQEGSRLDALQGYEWPKGVELVVEPVKTKRVTNAGLQLVAEADDTDKKSSVSSRLGAGGWKEFSRRAAGCLCAARPKSCHRRVCTASGCERGSPCFAGR
ncbi:MAG: BatA domain-containing protein [Verrucomicrobia bacterium]|nr:BatA domain-containing protein [Verrucomicrobiota bacterium]